MVDGERAMRVAGLRGAEERLPRTRLTQCRCPGCGCGARCGAHHAGALEQPAWSPPFDAWCKRSGSRSTYGLGRGLTHQMGLKPVQFAPERLWRRGGGSSETVQRRPLPLRVDNELALLAAIQPCSVQDRSQESGLDRKALRSAAARGSALGAVEGRARGVLSRGEGKGRCSGESAGSAAEA